MKRAQVLLLCVEAFLQMAQPAQSEALDDLGALLGGDAGLDAASTHSSQSLSKSGVTDSTGSRME